MVTGRRAETATGGMATTQLPPTRREAAPRGAMAKPAAGATGLRAALDGEPERSAPAATGTYEKLRLAILTGEVRPNEPLVELDLARALNVSRTPIREALQRLGADGLIVPRKRGWAVREYSQREVEESYELRAALEGYAARLAARRATDEQLAGIAAIQAAREAQSNPTREFRVANNRQFHDAIIAAARNQRLADEIFRSGQFYFNYRIAGLTSEQDYISNRADHGRIVSALLARDEAEAEAAMRAHILQTFNTYRRVNAL